MNKILSSASKLVFLLITITACAGFLIKLLPVDQFMLLAVSAFSFYFSNKGEQPPTTSTTTTTGTTETKSVADNLPYLGK